MNEDLFDIWGLMSKWYRYKLLRIPKRIIIFESKYGNSNSNKNLTELIVINWPIIAIHLKLI
tara:strand:- start:115 stop:300 length:186 start_codon:yes stop_codon:yes gene_type:complete